MLSPKRFFFLLPLLVGGCAAIISLGDEPQRAAEDGGSEDAADAPTDAPTSVSDGSTTDAPVYVDLTFGTKGFLSADGGVSLAISSTTDAGPLYWLGSSNAKMALYRLQADGTDAGITIYATVSNGAVESPQLVRIADDGVVAVGGEGVTSGGMRYVVANAAGDFVQNTVSVESRVVGLGHGSQNKSVFALADVGENASLFTNGPSKVSPDAGRGALVAYAINGPPLLFQAYFVPGASTVRVFAHTTNNPTPPTTIIPNSDFPATGKTVSVDGGVTHVDLFAPKSPSEKRFYLVGSTTGSVILSEIGEDDTFAISSISGVVDPTFDLQRSVLTGQYVYAAGCGGAPAHSVVYRFRRLDMSSDETFGNGGRVDIEGPAGECAIDLAVDSTSRVYLLLGATSRSPKTDSISSRIARLK